MKDAAYSGGEILLFRKLQTILQKHQTMPVFGQHLLFNNPPQNNKSHHKRNTQSKQGIKKDQNQHLSWPKKATSVIGITLLYTRNSHWLIQQPN